MIHSSSKYCIYVCVCVCVPTGHSQLIIVIPEHKSGGHTGCLGVGAGGCCLVSCAASNGRSYHRLAHRPYHTWPLSAPHWIIPHGGPAHLQSSPLSQGPISALAPLSAMEKRRKGARWRELQRREGGRGYFMLLRGNGSQQQRQLPITLLPLCWTGSNRWSDHRN